MKKIILSSVASAVLLFGAYDTVGTDYSNTVVQEYTEEPALETLETVNMILGFIRDSKIDNFVNKGPYKALLKSNENGGGTSSGSGTSTKVEKLEPMTLNVTRNTTIANAPMIVKFWLDVSDGPDNMTMRVIGYINVEKGVSKEYPVGKLRLDFQGFPINTTTGETNSTAIMMKGAMILDKSNIAGRADVKYIEYEMGDNGWEEPNLLNMTYDVSVDTNKDGIVDDKDTQGKGEAFTHSLDYSNNTMKSYEFTFSNDHYKIQDINTSIVTTRINPTTGEDINGYELIGTPICKSKTTFDKKVYQYRLYDKTTGEYKNVNGGFPIKKVDSTKYGYIGYWGLWSENNEIKAGDRVIRDDDSKDTTEYTVFQTKGKLIKYTKSQLTMDKLNGNKISFGTYQVDDNGDMVSNTDGNYILRWDKDAEVFKVYGIETCDENGCTLTAISSTGDVINLADAHLKIDDWSTGWNDALQTNVPIKTGLNNGDTVSYYAQEIVNPDANLTLVNFGNTIINPDMNLSVSSSTNGYAPEAIDNNGTNGVIGRTYLYDTTDGVLLDLNDSNKPVVIPTDTNWSNATSYNWQWGASIEPLLTSEQANNYNSSNYWDASQNETTYYKWETGLNNYNIVSGLKKPDGTAITFDAPKNIQYTHTTDHDINGDSTHDGEMFMIHYDGNGLGLPWNYDSEKDTWMPTINIKSATVVGDYVIKAIGLSDLPQEITGDCSGDITPIKDVNGSFAPLNGGSSMLDTNDSIIGSLIEFTPPDSNVTVIKGELIK
jgi:hypothetical protein